MSLRKFIRDFRGATAIEYALLISLLAMAGWSSFSLVGGKISGTFNKASTAMTATPSSSGGGGGGDDDDDD